MPSGPASCGATGVALRDGQAACDGSLDEVVTIPTSDTPARRRSRSLGVSVADANDDNASGVSADTGARTVRASPPTAIMNRQARVMQERRMTPGPPLFGMSRQNAQVPQSSRKQPSHWPHLTRRGRRFACALPSEGLCEVGAGASAPPECPTTPKGRVTRATGILPCAWLVAQLQRQ